MSSLNHFLLSSLPVATICAMTAIKTNGKLTVYLMSHLTMMVAFMNFYLVTIFIAIIAQMEPDWSFILAI